VARCRVGLTTSCSCTCSWSSGAWESRATEDIEPTGAMSFTRSGLSPMGQSQRDGCFSHRLSRKAADSRLVSDIDNPEASRRPRIAVDIGPPHRRQTSARRRGEKRPIRFHFSGRFGRRPSGASDSTCSALPQPAGYHLCTTALVSATATTQSATTASACVAKRALEVKLPNRRKQPSGYDTDSVTTPSS
jgi:hypothetical protein